MLTLIKNDSNNNMLEIIFDSTYKTVHKKVPRIKYSYYHTKVIARFVQIVLSLGKAYSFDEGCVLDLSQTKFNAMVG